MYRTNSGVFTNYADYTSSSASTEAYTSSVEPATIIFQRWHVGPQPVKSKNLFAAQEFQLQLIDLPAFLPRLSYRNQKTVEAYLKMYPEIQNFIDSAWPALVAHFGEHVEVVLEVMVYPDEESTTELVGWIQSRDTVEITLENFEQFTDHWYLDHMGETENKFNFNIEIR